nr:MAG TPA_asm: hypothetical protein [Caudoviricetes sp.]
MLYGAGGAATGSIDFFIYIYEESRCTGAFKAGM